MDALIQGLAGLGPAGLIVAALVYAVGYLVKYHTAGLKSRVEELRADKAQLAGLVEKNAEAITRNTAAIEHFADNIQQNSGLIQRLLEKLHS